MTTSFEATCAIAKASASSTVNSLSEVDSALRNNASAATSGGFLASTGATAGGGARMAASLPILGWKRVLDVMCIVISLPLVIPLMAVIVLWIRLVSRGPALFRQERIGRDGKSFVLYKFRSMKMGCGTGPHEAYLRNLVASNSPMIKLDLLCDSRVIPGGCLLRSAGLDELPQLLNVLRGEMSLVGPRPCLPEEYRYFSTKQRERFKVLPGLTGIWQVDGKNETTFLEMNIMDEYYVNHVSAALDLGIMMRTPSALLLQIWQASQQKKARRQRAGFQPSAGKPSRRAFLNVPVR
jgi:lipopolysaccharide/colanic/teichoic acid biosynthesis glycosyltransferase